MYNVLSPQWTMSYRHNIQCLITTMYNVLSPQCTMSYHHSVNVLSAQCTMSCHHNVQCLITTMCNVLSPQCTQIQRHTLFPEITANWDLSACTTLHLPASRKVAFKYLTCTKAEEPYHHGVWPSNSLRIGAVCCSVIHISRSRVQWIAALSWPVTRSRQSTGTKYAAPQSKSLLI